MCIQFESNFSIQIFLNIIIEKLEMAFEWTRWICYCISTLNSKIFGTKIVVIWTFIKISRFRKLHSAFSEELNIRLHTQHRPSLITRKHSTWDNISPTIARIIHSASWLEIPPLIIPSMCRYAGPHTTPGDPVCRTVCRETTSGLQPGRLHNTHVLHPLFSGTWTTFKAASASTIPPPHFANWN